MCYARRQRSSWARIKLSKNSISTSFDVNTVFRVSLTLILLLCLVCVFFWNFRDLSHDTKYRSLCFISRLVVQFSMTYAALCCTAFLLYCTLSRLSIPFWNFFKISFAEALASARINARFCAALLVYHFYPRLSIGFFKVFSRFCVFFIFSHTILSKSPFYT